MSKLARLGDIVAKVSVQLASLILVGLMVLTLVEVVSRYVLHNPLILADEFGGYSLVAITMIGLAYCWKTRGHVRVTFIVKRIPKRLLGIIRITTLSIALIYIGIAGKVSYELIIDAFRRRIKANSWLLTPLAWPQMVIPIGFTLLFIVLISELYKAIKTAKEGTTEYIIEEDESA